MNEECQLLRQFAESNDQAAFTQIVDRYADLVYSAALRQIRDAHLAEDVTQVVFANLAGKAGKFPESMTLAGWLHTDTRFVVLRFLRKQKRRMDREMDRRSENSPPAPPDWEPIRPVIDEALQELGSVERDAVLLRFFEDRGFDDIGKVLGLGSDAARMRVNRALEKLRDLLVKRGVTTSAAALAALLTAHGLQSAPARVVPAVISGLLGGGTVGLGKTALLEGVIMSKTKLIIIGTGLVLGMSAPVVWQNQINQSLQQQNSGLRQQLASLQSAHQEAAETMAGLRTELTRLQQRFAQTQRPPSSPPATPAIAQSSGKAQPVEKDETATEAEVADFLRQPPGMQAAMLGTFRKAILEHTADPTTFKQSIALAKTVRPKLEELENRPEDFAAFQTEYIKEIVGLDDETKVQQLHDMIQKTYEQAVAQGLNSNSRPASDVEDWAKRRDALDRPATRAVEALLSEAERKTFGRYFLGVMGIDLGFGDGGWNRFVTPQGGVVFPSEQ